jgi:cobalt/nickel transport system ATP-binding protein
MLLDKAIEIESLSYKYPDGHQALCDINLVVGTGETVAIIGPNGAGKSTLLLHLNGIIRTDGRVRILGVSMDDKNLKWVRSKVGMVFQNPDDQLFSPTVFDDVAFGPLNMEYTLEEVRGRVSNSLELVGMQGYEERSPHHLSVGEKKLVSIATILSMSPEILVIDEPTANLDPRAKWEFTELVKGLTMTKIVASHDLEMVAVLCDRTIILNNGKIAADDATPSIMSNTALLERHGLAPVSQATGL